MPVGDQNFADWFLRQRAVDESPPDVSRDFVIDAAIDDEPPLVLFENVNVDVEWFIWQWQSSPANTRCEVCNLTDRWFDAREIQVNDLRRNFRALLLRTHTTSMMRRFVIGQAFGRNSPPPRLDLPHPFGANCSKNTRHVIWQLYQTYG